MCRRYFLMNNCWYRFTYAVYVYVMWQGKVKVILLMFISQVLIYCRSCGQQGVKTEKFVSISSFFKPKKKHRGTVCNIHLQSNFTGIYCIIMPCVLANSLTLSLLPGFDKKSVTLYIVNIHEKLGQMLRFWILYVFTVLRTEEKIGCRGIKKQRKKIKCYVRLSLLQMFYALNISETVLRHYWLYRVSSLFFLTTLTHFNLIKKMKSMHE